MKAKKSTATKNGPATPAAKRETAKPVAPVKVKDEVLPTTAASAPEKAAVKPKKTAAAKADSAPAKSVQPLVTAVEAKIDVGFGNRLFIRGQGDGLTWDKGTPMTWGENGSWIWSTTKASDRVEFKLLLNDQIWAQGENHVLLPGEKKETVPVF